MAAGYLPVTVGEVPTSSAPSMLILKPNTYYKTRDGRKAFVGFRHPSNGWVGYIETEPYSHTWLDNGRWCSTKEEFCRDLISEWTDAPAVGSYAWANSLPVGSKVRWKDWPTEWHVTRTENGWARSHEILAVPGQYSEPPSGWLLYTEPKLRPWKSEEVPLGAWMRIKDTYNAHVGLIISANATRINRGSLDSPEFDHALNHYEHSTDGGKTWKPCGVME